MKVIWDTFTKQKSTYFYLFVKWWNCFLPKIFLPDEQNKFSFLIKISWASDLSQKGKHVHISVETNYPMCFEEAKISRKIYILNIKSFSVTLISEKSRAESGSYKYKCFLFFVYLLTKRITVTLNSSNKFYKTAEESSIETWKKVKKVDLKS